MKKYIWLFCSLILTVFVSAQSSSCLGLYESAFDTTQSLCSSTGRNQACYGNNTVSLTSFSDTVNIEFDTPGDITDIEKIRSLSLSSLNENNSSEWGIAMLRLLANLNPTQTENLTMFLFGDVEVETATDDVITYPVSTYVASNMRQYPNTSAFVVASVPQNTEIDAIGRLADNSWLQVHDTENNTSGWISAELLAYNTLDEIPIIEATQPYFGPMQAFYFRSNGLGDGSNCSSVPVDGLMIQTPEGVGRVTVWVNEITFDFLANTASTAMIYPPTDNVMTVDMLEGAAAITSDQGGYVAVAGSSISIETPADGDGSVKVNAPEPIAQSVDNSFANKLLPRNVEDTVPTDVGILANANNLTSTQYDEVLEYGHVLTASESSVQTNRTEENSTDGSQPSNTNGGSSSDVIQSDSNNNSSSNSNNSQSSTGSSNPTNPADSGGGADPAPADSGSGDNGGGEADSSNNDDSDSNSGNDDCPGNSCNAPGQNKDKDKDCPGNSCNAPGQNKDKKNK